ncbi:MAG: magnesium transporter [Armatimonadetes bacterium]|nr:magnesium transporter [Armatimonadota bacterium]
MPTPPGTALDHQRREQLIEEIARLVEEGQLDQVKVRLDELHHADQAEILAELAEDSRNRVLKGMPEDRIGELLEYLDEEPRARFVGDLEGTTLSRILVHVDEELVADIVEELPDERVEEVLSLLSEEDRENVAELLRLPEDSAGRWMSPNVVAFQRHWTVDEAFRYLRRERPDADQPFYLYTVDSEGRLQGVVSLRKFIISDPETRLEDIMISDVLHVAVDMDQEQAAEMLRHYDLMALPVVDGEGHLVGVLTADDVLDVQVEEATEDIYLQAGLDADASPHSPIGPTLRRRVPWLLANLTIGFLSALIVSYFEGTIATVAALAAFMPIVAGHGGNTGSQTTTLVVRGIALGEIYRKDIPRMLMKELMFGLFYGCLAGVLTGCLAYLLTRNLWMAAVVFLAMAGNILVAGLAGATIPLGLRALNIDPALASTVWLTTFTDWVGFLLLLGLGTYVVQRLM